MGRSGSFSDGLRKRADTVVAAARILWPVLLLVPCGIVAEYARAANVRFDMQSVLDATAQQLAREAEELDQLTLERRAGQMFRANFYGLGVTWVEQVTVEKDPATRTLTVAASGRVETGVLGLFRYETMPVAAATRVSWAM
ncbi:hypothetical protein IMF23_05960 [Chelatococcus daeguensis]|uniref:hypothetical protein n=1 Tax=Chelatococcus TaxID=28209 RepID=UPI0007AB6775|nr:MULTISPECIES: hypothetical protein [Chelatococcus]KZE33356.1 hypothetical protein AVW15_19050 [Chelatococcus daeguensis]MBM3082975.1 hypothetical protein [Chelatococcus daeguensis]